MAPTTIDQTDRNFVMHDLLPRLMRVIGPYMARLDAAGVNPGMPYALRYGSYQEFYAALIDQLTGYEPHYTPTLYDHTWANLAAAVNRIAEAVANNRHSLGLSMQPDRYADALATVRILPGDASEPTIKLLDVLRGDDKLPAILTEIHQYAATKGYPDWSVPVPPSPDHFYRRRYTAHLSFYGQVFVFATGTPASRLVWRVYADADGQRYLGILALMGVNGWTPVSDPERGGRLIHELLLTSTEPGVRISQIKDITVPCGDFEYEQLLTAVRQFVSSKYADGHVSEGDAWDMAVVMPAMMAGIQVTRTDLRRALTEADWSRRVPYGYWYHI